MKKELKKLSLNKNVVTTLNHVYGGYEFATETKANTCAETCKNTCKNSCVVTGPCTSPSVLTGSAC